jgi:hypothetical protein
MKKVRRRYVNDDPCTVIAPAFLLGYKNAALSFRIAASAFKLKVT